MYQIPYVTEHMNVLANLEPKDPRFMEKVWYIRGMLDVYEREVKDYRDGQLQTTWEAFSYMLASKLAVPAYFALREKVMGTEGALEGYSNDFYKIDAETLCKHKDTPFLWVLRKLGTQLYFTKSNQPGFTDLQFEEDAIKNVADSIKTFGNCLYVGYWDGTKLIDLTLENWKEEYNDLTS